MEARYLGECVANLESESFRITAALSFSPEFDMLVFKILDADEWRAAQDTGVYRGSAADRRDGFIHLSTSAQLPGTLTRHFADADNLMLVAVDTDAMGEGLKWETSSSDTFPHLYGELALSAVRWSSRIPRKSPGVYALPVQAFVNTGEAPGKVN
jgi:uncharacterized protein (DUF952 family)